MAKKLNKDWDLSQIYLSFKDPAFIFDLSETEVCFSEIRELLNTDCKMTSDYLLCCLRKMDNANMLLSKVSSFVNLTLLVDSSNNEAMKYTDNILTLQAASHQCLILLQGRIYDAANIEESISECKGLVPYSYFLHEGLRANEHHAPVEIEETILKMQINGSRAWQSLRDSLDGSAAAAVKLNGKKKLLPLSKVRSLASSPEDEIRREAYKAELDSYKNYETPMAACLSAIKGEALITAKMRGYNDALDQMLDINKMDRETLDTMLYSIEAHLPAFHRYLKAKSHLLGHKNGLPWYDLLAPIGQSSLTFSYEEAHCCLTDIFMDFDRGLGSFIDNSFKSRWIDAAPKKGKIGGALCADLPFIKENRIFANFNGSYSNLRTLAHELGHAFHSRCLDEIPLVMRDAPTPVCETASLFNETVVQEHMLFLANSDEKIFILEAGLSEAAQTVVDIYSRFLFEKEVFARREKHSLSAAELCEIMLQAQHKAYGNCLDPDYLHPYMWMCKVHYYIPEFHYYNFPYTFGLLFAKGLYANYKCSPENFMSKYIELLKSTCSDNMTGIAKRAGIDIHDSSFWDSSLDMIVKDIDDFLKLCKISEN